MAAQQLGPSDRPVGKEMVAIPTVVLLHVVGLNPDPGGPSNVGLGRTKATQEALTPLEERICRQTNMERPYPLADIVARQQVANRRGEEMLPTPALAFAEETIVVLLIAVGLAPLLEVDRQVVHSPGVAQGKTLRHLVAKIAVEEPPALLTARRPAWPAPEARRIVGQGLTREGIALVAAAPEADEASLLDDHRISQAKV